MKALIILLATIFAGFLQVHALNKDVPDIIVVIMRGRPLNSPKRTPEQSNGSIPALSMNSKHHVEKETDATKVDKTPAGVGIKLEVKDGGKLKPKMKNTKSTPLKSHADVMKRYFKNQKIKPSTRKPLPEYKDDVANRHDDKQDAAENRRRHFYLFFEDTRNTSISYSVLSANKTSVSIRQCYAIMKFQKKENPDVTSRPPSTAHYAFDIQGISKDGDDTTLKVRMTKKDSTKSTENKQDENGDDSSKPQAANEPRTRVCSFPIKGFPQVITLERLPYSTFIIFTMEDDKKHDGKESPNKADHTKYMLSLPVARPGNHRDTGVMLLYSNRTSFAAIRCDCMPEESEARNTKARSKNDKVTLMGTSRPRVSQQKIQRKTKPSMSPTPFKTSHTMTNPPRRLFSLFSFKLRLTLHRSPSAAQRLKSLFRGNLSKAVTKNNAATPHSRSASVIEKMKSKMIRGTLQSKAKQMTDPTNDKLIFKPRRTEPPISNSNSGSHAQSAKGRPVRDPFGSGPFLLK